MMWATMLRCHRLQHSIIKSLSWSCKLETPFDSEPRRQAALLLSIELDKLRPNLENWIASHRAYLCSLNLWLPKCMKPLRKRKSSSKQNSAAVDISPTECAVAPMFATCETWLGLLDDLPTEDLEEAIEGLAAGISRHLPRHSDGRDAKWGDGGVVFYVEMMPPPLRMIYCGASWRSWRSSRPSRRFQRRNTLICTNASVWTKTGFRERPEVVTASIFHRQL